MRISTLWSNFPITRERVRKAHSHSDAHHSLSPCRSADILVRGYNFASVSARGEKQCHNAGNNCIRNRRLEIKAPVIHDGHQVETFVPSKECLLFDFPTSDKQIEGLSASVPR